MKILANDGISNEAIIKLEKHGFEVDTTKVAQEQLINYINKNNIEIVLVQNATKIKKDLIEACTNLKLIGKAGQNTSNIDIDFATAKGVNVIKTTRAMAPAVAELVIAHLLSGVRFLYDSNRNMPLEGDTQFDFLNKAYSKGTEIYGKTLGIIGFGVTGQEVAKKAIALGMNILAFDIESKSVNLILNFYDNQVVNFTIQTTTLDDLLSNSDFITIHIPATTDYIFTEEVFSKVKKGVGLINTSTEGIIDEVALTKAIDDEIVSFVGLDVFNDEPNPAVQILMNPQISMTPHIGGSTIETQRRMSMELADQIIDLFKK